MAPPVASEQKAETELSFTRGEPRGADGAERRRPERQAGVREMRAVEEVEDIDPDLHRSRAERRPFRGGEVRVEHARAACIAGTVAPELILRGVREAAGV